MKIVKKVTNGNPEGDTEQGFPSWGDGGDEGMGGWGDPPPTKCPKFFRFRAVFGTFSKFFRFRAIFGDFCPPPSPPNFLLWKTLQKEHGSSTVQRIINDSQIASPSVSNVYLPRDLERFRFGKTGNRGNFFADPEL
jgi:hypothetical protein